VAARWGSSAVTRSSRKTRAISRPCKGSFGDRASPLIGPQDPPVNILGGYRFSGAPKITLAIETETTPDLGLDDPKLAALIGTIPADLSIPDFLRRSFKSEVTPPAQAAE
jgi:hypothetical protein